MQQKAWCPQPEDRRADQPGRDQCEPPDTAKIRTEGHHQPTKSARDKKPDREQRLVGSRANMDAPDTCVQVLVELADRKPPQEEPDDLADAGRQKVVGRRAEQIVDDGSGCPAELEMSDQTRRERVL